MKILFVTTGKYPHVGGKSSHIETILRGATELGNDCEIVSYSNIPENQLRIATLRKIIASPLRLLNFDKYVWMSEHIMQDIFASTVQAFCKGKKYDVILAEDPSAVLISSRILDKSTPIILVMHSYFGKSMGIIKKTKFSPSVHYFERQKSEHISSIKIVKKIIAVDDRIQADCLQYVKGLNLDVPVVSIENFVDTEKYCPLNDIELRETLKKKYGVEDKTIISCIRRLCDKNGVIYAVNAMKKLSNDYKLLVGGDGDCMSEILDVINRENLSQKVTMLGSINSEKVRELYQISDYAVVPSITVNGLQEATSISALEAMSFGIPTIASSIGGLKQMIRDHETGILVDEKDSESIAAAIIELSNNPDTYNSISQRARKVVIDKYSYIQGAKRYLNEMENTIGAK